jgi:hypothetical protein
LRAARITYLETHHNTFVSSLLNAHNSQLSDGTIHAA